MPSSEDLSRRSAVEFEHVTFAYRDEPVIEDATLALPDRSFVLVLGPNGGGKTTLGKLLLGLLRPDSGRVRVMGQPPSRVLGSVGYVPQIATGSEQFPIPVGDVVRMGLWGSPHRSRTEKRSRVESALSGVGLADFVGRPYAALSRGQRQRVLIARALVSNPHLLLLDEPTASVDAESRERIYDILTRLAGQAMIFLISHDSDVEALPVTDRIRVHREVDYLRVPRSASTSLRKVSE